MRKYREFPYPLKTKTLTVYGRKGCPYCEKMKDYLDTYYIGNKKNEAIYHDIFDIIDSEKARDVTDFKKKMKPFIDDYQTVPMIFVHGHFLGGYDSFCKLVQVASEYNKKMMENLEIDKELSKKLNNIHKKFNKCKKNKKST